MKARKKSDQVALPGPRVQTEPDNSIPLCMSTTNAEHVADAVMTGGSILEPLTSYTMDEECHDYSGNDDYNGDDGGDEEDGCGDDGDDDTSSDNQVAVVYNNNNNSSSKNTRTEHSVTKKTAEKTASLSILNGTSKSNQGNSKLPTGQYFCSHCRKRYSKASHLRRHSINEHSGAEGKKFICPVCKKSFVRDHLLQRHVLIHTGQKPFTCRLCEKQFNCELNLRRHVICVHDRSSPGFKCRVCFTSFTDVSSMRQHLRSHTGEKPFGCDTCGRRFTRSGSHNRHVLTHTKGRPFECKVCGRGYTRNYLLTTHVKKAHHDSTVNDETFPEEQLKP